MFVASDVKGTASNMSKWYILMVKPWEGRKEEKNNS